MGGRVESEKMSIVADMKWSKPVFRHEEPEILALSDRVAYNSPTFANLTKVSLTEKISLKPKNIKYG